MNESNPSESSRRPSIDTLDDVAKALTAAEQRRALEAAYARHWPGLLVRDEKLPEVASGGSYL